METMKDKFQLKSVKLMNGGGIEAVHTSTHEDGGVTHTREQTVKDTVVPHPDLRVPMLRCNELLFRVLGYDKFKGKKEAEDALENLSCHKVTIKGDEENKYAIVTGKLETNGTKIAINSPRVKVDGNGYGFSMTAIVEALESEVYKYFYEGKKAQLDIADELEGGPGKD